MFIATYNDKKKGTVEAFLVNAGVRVHTYTGPPSANFGIPQDAVDAALSQGDPLAGSQ